jgi:HEAT repeat protein
VALFGRLSPERALPSLLKMLRPDDDDSVVLQAVAAQAEAAFDTFVDLTLGLGAGGPEMVTVSKVARYIQDPRLPTLLSPMAESRSPEVREALARLWIERPDLIDAALLARLAQDPVVAVRMAVAAACAVGGRTDGLAALAADPAPEVRAMTSVAALLLGERDALPDDLPRDQLAAAAATLPTALLHARATDPAPQRRRAGGVLLALLGDPAAVRMASEDPAPHVRTAVGAALGA